VRLALTSSRTGQEGADGLGIGLSSLTRWIGSGRDEGGVAEGDSDLRAELKRPRRENAVLTQERDILKTAAAFFAKDIKSMSFAFIEAEKAHVPITRMCRTPGASQSGYFAWPDRPACQRQRADPVHLAHIGTAFALSNGTYGSPCIAI